MGRDRTKTKNVKAIQSGQLNIILLRCMHELTTHLQTEAY